MLLDNCLRKHKELSGMIAEELTVLRVVFEMDI